MKVKKSAKSLNYNVHGYINIQVIAEIMMALEERDDCYQPTSNSDLVRCAVEVMHEVFVPDNIKELMSVEQAYNYLKSKGFKVPSASTVKGTQMLRKLAKDIEVDNIAVEEASESQTAKVVAEAFIEATTEEEENEDENA